MSNGMTIGLPWYRREDWKRSQEIMSDADMQFDTFDEWLAEALEIELTLIGEGHNVRRVPVDLDKFPAWCLIRGLQTNGEARSRFAAEWVRDNP